mmetsp:Transcript_8434/g.20254  ORF Transcript_8434/g.20254 Transcript_8434/m.20254 type:complete len:215 (-) Transcript_8434:3642-4286(-)
MLASAAVDAARHVISAAWPLHPVLCWLGGGTSIARTLSRSEGEYDAMHLASAAAEIHRSDGVEFVLTGAEPSWAPWLPGSCALVAVDERERLNRLLPLPNSGTGAPGASGRKPSPITAREELPDPLLRPSDPDAHFGATLSHLPACRGQREVGGSEQPAGRFQTGPPTAATGLPGGEAWLSWGQLFLYYLPSSKPAAPRRRGRRAPPRGPGGPP